MDDQQRQIRNLDKLLFDIEQYAEIESTHE